MTYLIILLQRFKDNSFYFVKLYKAINNEFIILIQRFKENSFCFVKHYKAINNELKEHAFLSRAKYCNIVESDVSVKQIYSRAYLLNPYT